MLAIPDESNPVIQPSFSSSEGLTAEDGGQD
jgi:hypothetical protein